MTNKTLTVRAKIIDIPVRTKAVTVKISQVPVKQTTTSVDITDEKTGKTRIKKIKVWAFRK